MNLTNFQHWATGGEEYYLTFNKGTHELRRITDDETGDYVIEFTGDYITALDYMAGIIESNIDYDNNL